MPNRTSERIFLRHKMTVRTRWPDTIDHSALHFYLGSEPHSLTTNKKITSVGVMTSTKQRAAARRNIKKAGAAAKRKRTVAHLPTRTRTALGKQGAKAARRKRRG